jgi:hypothetical protein
VEERERSRGKSPGQRRHRPRKKGAPGIREQRRRGKEISQGLMRNFRKLQGPVCKEKFPIDLKP